MILFSNRLNALYSSFVSVVEDLCFDENDPSSTNLVFFSWKVQKGHEAPNKKKTLRISLVPCAFKRSSKVGSFKVINIGKYSAREKSNFI